MKEKIIVPEGKHGASIYMIMEHSSTTAWIHSFFTTTVFAQSI
jgi:hypothetical protein